MNNHQQVPLYKLYPPANDGTALKAKFWPALGSFVEDSSLVHAPNLKLAGPLFVSTVMVFDETLRITPRPVTAEDGFKQEKSPDRLRSLFPKAEFPNGYPY